MKLYFKADKIKKATKNICCVILIFTFVFTLSGCNLIKNILDPVYGDKLVAMAEDFSYISFSRGEEGTEPITVTLEEFAEYSVENSSLRSSLAYNTLDENQKIIYKAFEYAMENSYSNIFVDSKITDGEDELVKILNYLSFDSPLLEQNLAYGTAPFSHSYAVPVLWLYEREAIFEGYYISVNNFTEELWDKKFEAVEKAKKIVDDIPTDIPELEKAHKLYRYVSENVEYTDYKSDDDPSAVKPFLYDALITGKTNCDGFSNSLALLYRLANIENAEKIYNAEDPNKEGHTWNIFQTDGKWYNADATNSTLTADWDEVYSSLSFAFADELQTYEHEYAEIYPACNEYGYLSVDAHLTDASSKAFVAAAKKAFNQNPDKTAFLILDSCNKSQLNKALQKLADSTNRDLETIYFECVGGRTAIYIY